ncbi:PTPDL family protein [Prosthecobacter sp. SYSU 5D2]|uniref:PTPDL family protein n=1 Tax=Prosthecobacter sp. SYSU 5D2 TaxID=3134134 RepID=UPI0031FEBB4B
MKSSRSRIALLAFFCGTSLLQADILILKNGTKYEGNVLSEGPTSIRMKYRLTPKIWDEKDFSRDEIQELIKQTPQEVELIELKKLLPTADLLPADRYEQIIQDQLRPFINKYEGTPEAKEAEAIAATLQEEKKRVSNGETKLAGKWLNATETQAEAYNIEAYKLLVEMREQKAKGNWIESLQVYDKFLKSRPPYTASTYYPEAVTEAMESMDKLGSILTKMAGEQPILNKQREEGLRKMEKDEQSRTRAAIDEEKNKWRAESEAMKRNGVRWIEPYKYDMSSISVMQKAVMAEKARLALVNLDELKTRNEAFVDVYRKIGEEDYTAGAAAFERIQGFSNVPDYKEVVADLKAKLLKLYADLVRKSQASQAAISGSSAIGGAASATVDDRVARILAQANGGAAPATGAPGATAPAPGAAPAPGTPGTAVPAPGAPATAPAPAANPPVQQQPAPQSYPPQAQAPVPAYVPPVEESNTQTYIMIGMGLLIVLFGAMAFMKKKG